MIAILTFVFVGGDFVQNGTLPMDQYILCVFILASSFGPVVALSNLSNNLLQTFASADRLFNLLDEEAAVQDVDGKEEVSNVDISYKNVNFGYEGREEILKDIMKWYFRKCILYLRIKIDTVKMNYNFK